MFLQPIRKRKFYKARRANSPDFVKLFRFTPESVDWLSEHFLPRNEETRGGALSATMKMKIFLRYMSDPGYQIGVGEDIGVSQPTVSNVVSKVAKHIVNKADIWIRFPASIEEIHAAKGKWSEKYHFPTAIGALDCTHIRIKKVGRNHHGDEYICRKNFPSINVQATCDADEIFTSVSAEWPGSVHDSRIWKNSAACLILRNFPNAILLADQGYAIEKCLMTPYQNPATPEERAYNNLLKRERVIIERCFGQLKQRFPILQGTVRLALQSIPTIVVACFILHNVSKYLKDDAVLTDEVEYYEDDDLFMQNDDEENNELRIAGQNKRRQLAQVIYYEN